MALNNDYMKNIREKYGMLDQMEKQDQKKEPFIGDFKRFIEYVEKNPSQDLWTWVSQQESVVRARESMESMFNAYLFELMKPQFAEFCKNGNLDVIKDYVDASILVSKEYVSPVEQYQEKERVLEETIRMQAKEIEELKHKKEREVIKI